MKCNCLKDLTDKIASELPTKNAEFANLKITSVSFDGEAILFDSKSPTQLSYAVTIEHEPIGRKKQTKINILGSYCPFCGVSLKEEAAHD
jgi:hypothetical protein